MKNITKHILVGCIVLAAIVMPQSDVKAESVLWTHIISDNLFGEWRKNRHYSRLMANTNIQVLYNTRVVNTNTGAIVNCGDNVPVGTQLRYEFVPHQPTDIYWFSTGSFFDSPYGSWNTNATRSAGGMCVHKNHFYTEGGVGFVNDSKHYGDVSINPPTKTVTGVPNSNCFSIAGNTTCDLEETGVVNAQFNFSNTFGKIYFGYSQKRNNVGICMVHEKPLMLLTNNPSRPHVAFGYTQGNNNVWVSYPNITTAPTADFTLQVPAQQITCPINVIQPQGQAPNAPTISGNPFCKAGVPHQFTITGTDPDTDPEQSDIRYAIDWNNDGTVNQLVPSTGYVTSGTSLQVSRVWRTPGVKTFRVRTEDKQGLFSPWTTFTTDECLESDTPLATGDDSLFDRHAYGSFPDGTLDFSLNSGITNSVCIGTWNASYVADCELYRNNEKVQDLPESGTVELLPGTYRIQCRQLNDGALLSQTTRCLLNPDVREI